MTISLGMKGYAEHLTQFSYLKRSDVYVSLAGNDAVIYLECVYAHLHSRAPIYENKPQKVITERALGSNNEADPHMLRFIKQTFRILTFQGTL